MTQDYTSEAQAVADAMNAVYENKQTNKKNTISGDFSSDNESYPTVKAVKTEFGTKVTSFSGIVSDSNYPSEKLVKDTLDTKLDIAQGNNNASKNVVTNSSGNITFEDKPTIPTDVSDLTDNEDTEFTPKTHTHTQSEITDFPSIPTSTSDLTNNGSDSSDSLTFIETSATSGLVKNDGTIDTNNYVTDATLNAFSSSFGNALSSKAESNHIHGKITNDGRIGTQSFKPLITSNNGAIDTGSFGTTAHTFAEGNHTHSEYLTSHQSLSDVGGVVTVEKQQTAETGYAHTYVIKQGSSSSQSQVGVKINIPKDFLVKSGEVKTVASADLTTLGNGYSVGDKYIDFVVNTKGNDGSDEHIYINVKDLVEDTTYTADNSTLQLSNGEFSIKNKGVTATQIDDNTITATQIAQKTITANELADSIIAKNITQSQINAWDTAVAGGLTVSDVQDEITAFATALANAINPSL